MKCEDLIGLTEEEIQDKISVHCISNMQDKIFDECMDKFNSGKLNNQGDKQLSYAGQFFQLEIWKREILNKEKDE